MAQREFTTVVAVDQKHLKQLKTVWPTWERHKPGLLDNPMVVIYDQASGISPDDIRQATNHPALTICSWPPPNVVFEGDPETKWYHPQRYKMLAAFVHVPAAVVTTAYWLKLDTDVVATGCPDWIDEEWLWDTPAICAHRWGFTKPANQMLLLDDWVARHREPLRILASEKPLCMSPKLDSDRLSHPRIISWCGFFNTTITRLASDFARRTCGDGQLPVPSQDGYLWYVATRLGYQVKRVDMKARGWEQWCTDTNIRLAALRALNSHGI